MVVASSTNAASGTPSGGGSAVASVSSAPPDRNDGRSSSDESEEEEVEWQPPGLKEIGETTGPQVISVDRAIALQTLGLLPSGLGSSSGMPVVVEIPPGEPSDLTVRVVGVPATEIHNDGRTFLQDGFGGLEALIQMERSGAMESTVLYDFFDDNDVIGDFILTPRETPLTSTELSSQLENFAVKREYASILSQLDSKQLALRTFGTVSLLRKVAAKYSRIERKLVEDDGAASVIELQDEVLRLKRDQQFHSSYWNEKVAEVQRERKAAVALMRLNIVLLMEEREKDIWSFRSQVQTLKMELETARTSRKTTALDHKVRVPPEWQTVITVMANDNLAFQAPPFVRMDPPQDEDDKETKECDSPAPDTFRDLSRGASTTKFGSKSSQLGKRASGSQSPKSQKMPASEASKNFQVNGSARRHPAARISMSLVVVTGTHIPEWRVTPGPSLNDREIDLLESEDDAEDKAEKDEDYNHHQDLDDGVDDEDEDPDEASDDGVLNVAQRTTKRRRLSKSSAEASTSKKLKAKSPIKTKVKAESSGKCSSGSGS
ncbi:unnamed protein product [Phytophthora fragariaefolia]|uniref:Unnamed protein product n=1 Tax=Phytophthora fragariaefolia TaxID=1490495 RepID=A0A9W6XWG9_9STRA|nr:unnamed protein product [Phytophthora fragariaefolia]